MGGKKVKKNKQILLVFIPVIIIVGILSFMLFQRPSFSRSGLPLVNWNEVTAEQFYALFPKDILDRYDSGHALVTPGGSKLFVGGKKINKYNYKWFFELNGEQYGPFGTYPESAIHNEDILISVSNWNENLKKHEYWLFVNNKQYGPYSGIISYENNPTGSNPHFVYDIAGKYAVKVYNEKGTFILHGEKTYGPYDQVDKLREFENEIFFTTYSETENKSYIFHGEKVYGPYGSIDSDLVFIKGTPAFLSWVDGKPYIIHNGRKIFINAYYFEPRESKEGELHFYVPFVDNNPPYAYGEFIYDKDGLRKVEEKVQS